MKHAALLVVAALSGCLANASEKESPVPPVPKRQQEQKLNRQVSMKIDYLLYLPPNHSADKKWPLIIFLHGAGERGSDLAKVKVHGPAKLVEQGREFPFVIVSPQCPSGQWWSNKVETVMALIDEIVEKYNIDETRIYLTGLSMGGYGTWSIAATYPQRFAAIAPICGGGMPFLAPALKDTPVWAFHGAKDPVVPLAESERMVAAVQKAGGNARLTVYPEAEHDSWTATYNGPQLYEWFLQHSRQPQQK